MNDEVKFYLIQNTFGTVNNINFTMTNEVFQDYLKRMKFRLLNDMIVDEDGKERGKVL